MNNMNESGREKVSLIIRMVAGAYLIYLAYRIITGMKADNNFQWYMILFSALFVIIGIVLLVFSVKRIFVMKAADDAAAKEEQERAEEDAAKEASEEAPALTDGEIAGNEDSKSAEDGTGDDGSAGTESENTESAETESVEGKLAEEKAETAESDGAGSSEAADNNAEGTDELRG